jgi:hypothetical protein
MITMSALLAAVSAIGKIGKIDQMVTAIIGLTAMCGLLVGFAWALSTIPDVSGKNAAIMTLVATMGALSLLLLALTGIGAIFLISGGTGAGAALAGMVGLIAIFELMHAFADRLLALPDVSAAIPSIQSLTTLMWDLTAMLTQLAIIGPLAVIGVAAMAGFEALMVATGTMAVAAAALMKIPGFEEFLNSGIGMLKRLAQGIGEIISSFAVGLTSGLPDVAANLSTFMTDLADFISGAESIPDNLGDKVKILTKAIVMLTAADLISGISSFRQNGSSLSDFGTELANFMTKARTFIIGAGTVKPETVAGVKSLAETILILTAADLLDGIHLFGNTPLNKFGEQLVAFGPCMAEYSKAVENIDVGAVEASANAAKALSEVAANLPNSGGVAGFFAGENDMGAFGEQLVAFGDALKNYSIAVTGIVLEPILTSVEAGKALAEMADVIPNLGGVASWFCGDNDLATFGTQIVAFGNALKNYSIAVTGLVIDPITQSVEAGKSLAGLAESIPNMGGMVTWFTGDNDFITFGQQIVAFGSALVSYSTAVAGLNVEAITTSITAATEMSKLATALPSDGGFWSIFKDDTMNFTDFGVQIVALGTAMSDYSVAVAGIATEAVTTSVQAAKEILSLIKSTSGLDTSGVKSFADAIATLGKTSIDKFVSAFSKSTGKLTQLGANMVKAVANGAKSASGNLTSVVNTLSQAMVNAFSKKQSQFQPIGTRIINALVTGLSSGQGRVSAIGSQMINGLITTLSAGPARVTAVGSQMVTAFVNALSSGQGRVVAIGNQLILALVNALNSNVAQFNKIGTEIVTQIINGIQSKQSTLASSMNTALSSCVTSIRGYYSNFYSAGGYLVDGFAAGIKANTYKAEAKAKAMAKAAYDAAKKELDINSPSRVFMGLGKSTGEGMAKGVELCADMAVKASKLMGANVIFGAAEGMSKNTNAMLKPIEKLKDDTLNGINEAFGIHSPAEETKPAGEQIVAGVAEGVSENTDLMDKPVEELADTTVTGITDAFDTSTIADDVKPVGEQIAEGISEGIADGISGSSNSIVDAANKVVENAKSVVGDAIGGSRLITDTAKDVEAEIIADYEKFMDEPAPANYESDGTENSGESWQAYWKSRGKSHAELKRMEESAWSGAVAIFGQLAEVFFADGWEYYAFAKTMNAKGLKDFVNRIKYKLGYAAPVDGGTLQWASIEGYREDGSLRVRKVVDVSQLGITEQDLSVLINDKDKESKSKLLSSSTSEEVEDKAKEITDKYQKEFDKLDLDKETADLEYDFWLANNKNASDADKSVKKLEASTKRIVAQTEKVSIAEKEYNEMVSEFGAESDEAQESYNKWLQEQITLDEETSALLTEKYEGIYDRVDRALETSDLEHSLWESDNRYISETEKIAKKAENIYSRMTLQTEKISTAQSEYKEKLDLYGADAVETQEAYNKYLEAQLEYGESVEELHGLITEKYDAIRDDLDRVQETNDLQYELWESQNEAADGAVKTATKAENIYDRIAYQTSRVATAQAEYTEKFNTFGANAAETQTAYNNWVKEQITLNNDTKSLLDLRNQSIVDANDAAKANIDLRSSLYKSWEASNPKATAAFKNTMQLDDMLKDVTDKAEIAGGLWAKFNYAVDQFGEDSVEATKARKEYIDAKTDLFSTIEKVGSTHYDTLINQRQAQQLYFSLMRGSDAKMMRDQGVAMEHIEEWARIQSGFDPELLARLTNMNVSGLKDDAIMTMNWTYDKHVANDFVDIGAQYGTSLVEGVETGVETAAPSGVTSFVTTFGETIATGLSTGEIDFTSIGKQFVEQFAQGVTNAVDIASEAVITMITSAYQAAVEFINDPENDSIGFTPKLTPILDLSNIQNGIGQLNGLFANSSVALADINVRLANDSLAEMHAMADEVRISNEQGHADIVNAITNLRGDFSTLVTAINNMHISLDSNTVVGTLINKIDTGLGQIAGHKGRGN